MNIPNLNWKIDVFLLKNLSYVNICRPILFQYHRCIAVLWSVRHYVDHAKKFYEIKGINFKSENNKPIICYIFKQINSILMIKIFVFLHISYREDLYLDLYSPYYVLIISSRPLTEKPKAERLSRSGTTAVSCDTILEKTSKIHSKCVIQKL